MVSDEVGLIGLLHRADWTQLRLSAEVSDGSTLLIAPGKRYRYESAGYVTGCDGGRPWELSWDDAGLAAGALGAWIRYSPYRRAQPAEAHGIDFEAAIPRDEPPPDLSPDRVPAGPPVSDDLLNLLHAGGPDRFAATLHQWLAIGALASSVPAAARRAGFGGLGLLMDAISDQPATGHLTSRIRVAGHGRYQIDHAYQPRHGPVTIACDGQRRWEVYPDKIITGPAQPLQRDIRDLADPSWLLRCWLSGGTTVPAGNRPGYRINAGRRHGDELLALLLPALLFPAAVAVVDPDLRLVLRLTSYIGTRPVQRHELRDVTTDVGEFRVDIPGHLPVVEQTRPFPT
jgi:hypothetical protein